MRLLVISTFALLARVESQCLTSDDDLPLPSQPHLDHITSVSIDLFHQIRPPKFSNFFFSPFSLWFSLIVTYLGSGGFTQGEMEEVLRLTNKAEAFALFKALNRGPQENNPSYTIAAANKIYIKEDIPLHECVQNLLSNEIQSLDFAQSDAAANTVNEFVKTATGGKIQDVVSPSSLKERVMLIVNAVYFKGLWEKRFAPEDTTREEFYITPGQRSPVDMMTQTAQFKHGLARDLDAQILEMPYQGKRVSMFVLLPVDRNTGQEVDNLVLHITKLKSAMADMRLGEVVVKLPKFKFENVPGQGIGMALYRMGLYELTRKGNFTSFSSDVRLEVSGYEHKATIEVDEGGFERPVAPAEGLSGSPPANFICNRPFMFYIYDNVLNTILFMGIYRQP